MIIVDSSERSSNRAKTLQMQGRTQDVQATFAKAGIDPNDWLSRAHMDFICSDMRTGHVLALQRHYIQIYCK